MVPCESEPGKRGRAIWNLDAKWMARLQGSEMGAYVLVHDQVGHRDLAQKPADTSIQLNIHNVCDTDIKYTVIDLYTV